MWGFRGCNGCLVWDLGFKGWDWGLVVDVYGLRVGTSVWLWVFKFYGLGLRIGCRCLGSWV